MGSTVKVQGGCHLRRRSRAGKPNAINHFRRLRVPACDVTPRSGGGTDCRTRPNLPGGLFKTPLPRPRRNLAHTTASTSMRRTRHIPSHRGRRAALLSRHVHDNPPPSSGERRLVPHRTPGRHLAPGGRRLLGHRRGSPPRSGPACAGRRGRHPVSRSTAARSAGSTPSAHGCCCAPSELLEHRGIVVQPVNVRPEYRALVHTIDFECRAPPVAPPPRYSFTTRLERIGRGLCHALHQGYELRRLLRPGRVRDRRHRAAAQAAARRGSRSIRWRRPA